MAFIHDDAFDQALSYISSNTENLYITSAEATTFTQASSTYKLGTKTSPTISSIGTGSPSGRKITVSVTGGTVNSTGTATHWALTDDSASKLLATGALASSQAVTASNTFDMSGADITITDAT